MKGLDPAHILAEMIQADLDAGMPDAPPLSIKDLIRELEEIRAQQPILVIHPSVDLPALPGVKVVQSRWVAPETAFVMQTGAFEGEV